MKYGLIGQNIGYSYSKQVHNLFGNFDYEIYSLNEDEVINLLKTKDFKGVNVTIPYKQMVIPYLDEVDDSVKSIGACNLIINKNGKLVGYNVDYHGVLGLIEKNKFDLKDKNVAILGSGATSKTVTACLNHLQVKNIYIISRNKTEYNYDSLKTLDIDYIINTTPVGGMNDDRLITHIPNNVKGVMDVIYRPLLTKFLLEAKNKNIKYANGMYMLVYQAYVTHAKFFDLEFNQQIVDEVYYKVLKTDTNIYLIGMPYSGKTTVGKALASRLDRNFIDIDQEIEKETKLSIPEIFKMFGEEYFRNLESKMIEKYKFTTNSVISLGGGAIKKEENMINCLQTGIIYNIKRDVNKIEFNDSRPLSKDREQYISLFLEREKLYNKYSSRTFINNGSLDDIVSEMESDFNETINS